MPYRLRARLSDVIVNSDLNMEGKNITGVNVFEGQKDVIAQYERLAKQVIIPTHAGEEALVVRDRGDSVSQVVFREDGTGQVRELSAEDLIIANNITLHGTVDGVDLSAHVADPSAHQAIDDTRVITQGTEPAVPAGKFRIWHDNTPGAERRWLISGTNNTVAGNMKVEIA